MRRASITVVGPYSVTTQKFAEAGETLGIHDHPRQEHTHITIIAKGRFKLIGSRDGEILNEGDLIYWKIDEPHGLIALEPGSVLYNVRTALPKETGFVERDAPMQETRAV